MMTRPSCFWLLGFWRKPCRQGRLLRGPEAAPSGKVLRLAARKGKFGGYAYYCWVAGVLSVILTLIF